MPDTDLDLISADLAAQSLSRQEIVLPYPAVLSAIAELERRGIQLLGWEGWLAYPDGSRGHSGEQGTTDLSALAVEAAARVCAQTIEASYAEGPVPGSSPTGVRYYCLVPAA